MAWELVIGVPLEDVGTWLEQLSYDINVATMRGKVQGSPLVDTSCYIHVEILFIA